MDKNSIPLEKRKKSGKKGHQGKAKGKSKPGQSDEENKYAFSPPEDLGVTQVPNSPGAAVYGWQNYQEFAREQLHDPRWGFAAFNPPPLEKKPTRAQKMASMVSFAGEALVGYEPEVAKKKTKLPPGWVVKHTPDGRPYMEYEGASDDDADEQRARMEHRRKELPWSCDLRDMRDRYGTAVYLYFDFVKFVVRTNLILAIIALVNFFAHIYYDWNDVIDDYTGGERRFALYYESYNAAQAKLIWNITSIVGVVVSFIFGPWYFVKIGRYFKAKNLTDITEVDEDERAEAKHSRCIILRRILSFLFSLLALAVCAVVTFLIIVAERYTPVFDYSSIVSSAVVAVALILARVFFKFVAIWLTKLEAHRRWSTFRNIYTFRYYVFRMLAVLIVYLTRWIVVQDWFYVPLHLVEVGFAVVTSSSVDVCSSGYLPRLGDQFLTIVVIDLIFQNIWEVGYSKTCYRWKRKHYEKGKGKGGDENAKEEFDLAEEYMEIIYRQFIVYLGSPYFPLLPLIAIISNIVEYNLDKYRLLRLSQEPHPHQGSMKHFLTFFLFFNALLAVVSFPFGTAWVVFQNFCFAPDPSQTNSSLESSNA